MAAGTLPTFLPKSKLPRWRPLGGVLARILLLVPLLIVFAVLWLEFGSDYGLPSLFWHEHWWLQILSGLGVGCLLGQVCFIAFMLDWQRPWLKSAEVSPIDAARPGYRVMELLLPDPPNVPLPEGWRRLRWYLSRSWLPLIAVAALPAVVYVTTDWPWVGDPRDYGNTLQHFGSVYFTEANGMPPASALAVGLSGKLCLVVAPLQRWPFLVGLLAAAIIGAILIRTVRRLGRFIPCYYCEPDSPAYRSLRSRLLLHLCVAAVGIGVIALLFRLHAGPPALCLALGLWASLHGGLLFRNRISRVEPNAQWMHHVSGVSFTMILTIYLALFLTFWFDHSVRGVAYWITPPALALCLLLSMIVTVYGFMRYHFGRRHWYVLGSLLAVGILANTLTSYKLHFPDLAGWYDVEPPVSIAEADEMEYCKEAQAALAEIQRRAANGKKRPDDEENWNAIQARLARCAVKGRRRQAAHEAAFGPTQAGAAPAVKPDPSELMSPDRASAICQEVDRRLSVLEKIRLENWERLNTRNGKKPKLAVVAVSGGANRSAIWTVSVLNRLEREFAKDGIVFPCHVRVVTGASGGMVGASYWVATLSSKNGHPQHDDVAFVNAAGSDVLTPVAQQFLFIDVPTNFLPGRIDDDRGQALEKAWGENLNGALEQSFQALAPGEAAGWRPSLIFAPMLVEDGRQLLLSNLYLPELTQNAGRSLTTERMATEMTRTADKEPEAQDMMPPRQRPKMHADQGEDYRYSLSSLEFFHLFPEHSSVRLALAARMNATFPYVSPAVDLPVVPRRRVVDAGYYDNFGVSVAAGWIYHHRRWLSEHTSGVVLIQIRDSESETRRLYAGGEEGYWQWSRGVEWLTGPLVGARSARHARTSFPNDALVHYLSEWFNDGSSEFFTTAVFELQKQVALSWFLTDQEKAHVRKSFDARPSESGAAEEASNRTTLRALRSWWAAEHQAR